MASGVVASSWCREGKGGKKWDGEEPGVMRHEARKKTNLSKNEKELNVPK